MPEGFKTCITCKASLPMTDFNARAKGKPGVRSICRECAKTSRRRWYVDNQAAALEYRRRYHQENKEVENETGRVRSRAFNARMSARETIETPESKTCSRCKLAKPGDAFARNRSRKDGRQSVCLECFRDRKYGLLPGEYDAMDEEQGGVCAICAGTNPHGARLSVDHHHGTGAVRGLLCQNCNAAIGMLREDPLLFERAVEYLKRG